MTPYYADPLVTLHLGDCIEALTTLEADSVDAVVTDPPYGLEFMGKRWDAFRPATANRGGKAPGRSKQDPTKFAPVAYGIGGRRSTQVCDGCGKRDKFTNPHACPDGTGWSRVFLDDDPRHASYGQAFQAWCEQWGREALRVTKPGGYLLAFGGTRTHHRLVCGLEDAGWIIRDELDWIYASGFPKGKANLKPAHEPIVLARKPGPLRPLAIDECRIGTAGVGYVQPRATTDEGGASWGKGEHVPFHYDDAPRGRRGEPSADRRYTDKGSTDLAATPGPRGGDASGRWPSNVLLSDAELFDEPNPEVVGSGQVVTSTSAVGAWAPRGAFPIDNPTPVVYGDSGGYSRFFIIPKADRAERERGLANAPKQQLKTMGDGAGEWSKHGPDNPGLQRANVHPTVKPIDLMRHLVRLVTPPGGVCLDPFLGSGTTALAASEEGLRCIGIEREAEYLEIAKGRLMATPMGLGLDVETTSTRKPARGHWPKERTPGKDGWGFSGQIGLEERYGTEGDAA